MRYQPPSRISPDATTLFSGRIRRIHPYNSNPCAADASVAFESVIITVPLGCQSQRECSGSGSARTPSTTSSLANARLDRWNGAIAERRGQAIRPSLARRDEGSEKIGRVGSCACRSVAGMLESEATVYPNQMSSLTMYFIAIMDAKNMTAPKTKFTLMFRCFSGSMPLPH